MKLKDSGTSNLAQNKKESTTMPKFLIAIMFLVFSFSLPVYAQNFEVREVGKNSEYVVLTDKDTGEVWMVRTGDEINDWKVVKITSQYVTLLNPKGETPAIKKIIPVNKENIGIIMSP